jgi:Flp pilus assembly protein TadG
MGVGHVTQSDQESGQTLLEFALVLMFVILPFMFVLVDGAMMLYTQAALTNAAREGARAGSIYQTTIPISYTMSFSDMVIAIDTARATYIQQEMPRLLGPLVPFSRCSTAVTYTPDPPIVNDVPNPYRELDSLTVRLACPRQLFFGLIRTSQITLTAQSTMRIEPGGVAPGP